MYVLLHDNTRFHTNIFSDRVTSRVRTDEEKQILTDASNVAWGSSVDYGLEGPEFEFRWVQNFLCPYKRSDRLRRPTSLPVNGRRDTFAGKAAGARQPPTSSSAEVKERVEPYPYSPYVKGKVFPLQA